MTESEIRQAVKKSRKNGYRAIFHEYYSFVYTVIWNHIRSAGSHEDAEECTSDVFLDVFRQFDRIEEGRLKSYIYKIAQYKSIDCFRKLTARPAPISLDIMDADTTADDTNLELDQEKLALRQVLLDKIKLLGEPDASIILMKYFYGFKPQEIAQNVHLKQSAVRTRLSRTMKRLRNMMENDSCTIDWGE